MTPVTAQTMPAQPDLLLTLITLLGGLALFLYGLDRLTQSLRLVAGDRMRGALQRMTGNRFAGVATGAGITAVIQSSTATTVLVVSFVSGGLLTFQQSLGVIMGANIGTTVTTQIIALDIGRYALILVAGGFGVSFLSRGEDRRAQGTLLMGLGLVFFGMSLMADAMFPLRDLPGFVSAMSRMETAWLAVAAGALFTALVQASAATNGVVIVLAGQGIISLEAGLALVIGANIGTSATALLAAVGKPRAAVRAAVAHTLFNVVGAVIWIFLIGVLAGAVTAIGGTTGRQVANAHTIFNLANTALFIGLTGQIARLVERLVPDTGEEERPLEARYLDYSLLSTPTLALDRARLELLRMASRIMVMLERALPAVLDGDRHDLARLAAMDDEIDVLHGAISTYLGRIGEERLSHDSTDEMLSLMEAANDLEAIGDIVETNLVTLGFDRIDEGVRVAPETRRMLTEFHRVIVEAVDMAWMAVTQKSTEAAALVTAMKPTVNSLEQAALAHKAERLVAPEPLRVPTYRFEIDVLSNLKRIYYHARRIARAAVPRERRPEL